jgi:hypothetical protein
MVPGSRINLCNEEFHSNLYPTTNITVTMSRTRLVGHAPRVVKHEEGVGVSGKKIL